MPIAALATLVAVGPVSAGATEHGDRNAYTQTSLVSDQPGVAQVQDTNLVNPWGMSASPTSPLWVSDNGADVATLYRGAVNGMPVSIVPLTVQITGGAPTGQVFNPTSDFAVSSGTARAPALFLFASENGHITGWNPMVDGTHSVDAVVDPNAVYKGLALVQTRQGSRLYAANFRAGTVDVFDGSFAPVKRRGAFVDRDLPPGYAPFNVQAIGDRLVVTYALQNAQKHDDVKGPGHGFVDLYSASGRRLQRIASRGALDSPWGIVVAPEGFGRFGGALLVGNFGDGRINAYDRDDGELLGTLRDAQHRPITIDGLWGLRFGNGTAGAPNTLLFTAGPNEETHGLLGTITATG